VRQTLYNSIHYFQGAYCLYNEHITQIAEKLSAVQSDGRVVIDIQGLLQQVDVATVLYELISPYGFNSSQLDDIVQALGGESGKTFYSETHRIVKDRASLIISAKADSKENLYIISQPDCTVRIPYPLRVSTLAVDASFVVSKSAEKIQLDAENILFPLTIRSWQEGDWFVPFGMKHRKKLSDFFIDLKLSIADKEKVQLLCSGDTILWVIGYRTDNRFRVQPQTSQVIQFEILH
jgi:tRNA(Ile)-lysidine synthase